MVENQIEKLLAMRCNALFLKQYESLISKNADVHFRFKHEALTFNEDI